MQYMILVLNPELTFSIKINQLNLDFVNKGKIHPFSSVPKKN